jgi:hypothetical protein
MNRNRTEISPCSANVEARDGLDCMTNGVDLDSSIIGVHSHVSEIAISSLDTMGMAASTICLVHCLLMPFVISMLPIWGWQILAGKGAHHALAAFVFAFALFAVVPGYIKHKHLSILISMITGLSLVVIATFACGANLPESLELPMITLGNLILVASHWQNRHLAACGHRH